MAACSSCGEWFHEDCVALPQDVWTKPDFKWSCASYSVCNIVFVHCNIYHVFAIALLPVLCNYGSHALNCVQY